MSWDMKLYPSNTTGTVEAVMLGLGWGQYHIVLEGLAIFLCMRGSGVDAMKRTAVLASLAGVTIGGLQTVAYLVHPIGSTGRDWAFMIGGLYQVILFAFYLALWMLPYSVFYRRPAAIGYAAFWSIYRPIYLIIYSLIFLEIDVGYCGYLVCVSTLFLL
jgi:hypothetical protein